MLSRLVPVLGLLALAGCSSASTAPVTNSVAAAEIALTDAEKIAITYTSLPRCPAATVICSDPAAVARIKQLDDAAYAAVKGAENNTVAITDALTAVGVFRAAVPAAAAPAS